MSKQQTQIPIRTLILDFDGTMADTVGGILATMRATFEKLSLPILPNEKVSSLIGLPLKGMFREMVDGATEEYLDICCSTYRELFPGIALTRIDLFPGVEHTIREMHRQGVAIALASSRSHKSLDFFMKKFSLEECIGVIMGDQDVVNKKPHPEMVQTILERTGTLPSQALVVGDTTFDIRMGSSAGAHTCGVTYGNHSRQTLLEASPTFLVDSFEEILSIARPLD